MTLPHAETAYRVAITRAPDYDRDRILVAVRRQFELLDPAGALFRRGDRVMLKPNCIVPRPSSCAAQTDPAVIVAVAHIVKDRGGRPFVADSPAWGTIRSCLDALGIADELTRMGVEIHSLNRPKAIRLDGVNGFGVPISCVAIEADAIINLPKFKSHQQLYATFAVKNMFGVMPGKRKPLWHYLKGARAEEFSRMLIEIYRYLSPAMNLIDAVVAMEGPGPINGKPRPVGVLVGGVDPIACERICCEIAGFDPECLPILRTAANIGFGCPDRDHVEVVGDAYDDLLCTNFEPARQVALRFSLPRVVKSIAKQAAYVVRNRIIFGRNRH